MPVIKKKRSNFLPSFIGTLFIVIIIISVILSVGNFIRYREILQKYDELKKYVDSKIAQVDTKLEETKNILAPNSILDKYIAAANQLRDFGYDFEKILSTIYDDPTTGYFMVFVAGNESSWFTIKSGDKTFFSGEIKPGLSNYRFFYFKEPRIKTNYDLIIPPDATITVGKTGRVYLLFFGVGARFHPTKVVQLTETTYEKFADKFSLYIPGK